MTSTADPLLPDDVADDAAERILAAAAGARDAVLAEIVAVHPQHANALRTLARRLLGAERLLDAGFSGPAESSPTQIGPYRVLRRLGEGAFGTVFLCAQEQPVRRSVAIKVLRPGAGDRQTLARFEAERQVLALLSHPAIAHVLDAGTIEDGRPFFVMEHVDGEPIQRYCERRGLSVDARLGLFLDVCRGVAHAHAKGIVHRDLKPANVLVVESEDRPRPKIIDFGIAKALHTARTADGVHTDTGRVVGTPGYMSPEQATGRIDEVDERTDVFALGVMLYELLTGELPWGRGAVTTDSEPPRPSSRIGTGSTSTATAAPPSRRRQLAAAIRGDLDWITLKALERERERRYAGMAALIADIERHQRGETVSAGPPSVTYRLRKFARRHRAAVVSTAVAGAVIAGGLYLALRHGQRADARTKGALAQADASFAEAIRSTRALLARANDASLRESDGPRQALAQDALAAADRLLGSRPEDPQLREERCKALLTLSQVHWLLGEMAHAESLADAARDEADRLVAADATSVLRRGLLADAQRKTCRVLAASGRQSEALASAERATAELEICHAAAPTDYDLSFSAAWREVAMISHMLNRMEESAAAFQRSVDILVESQQREPDSPAIRHDLVFARVGLGQELMFQSRLDEAEDVLVAAEGDLSGVTLGADEAASKVYAVLGRIAQARNDPSTAADWLRRAADAARKWQQQHPDRLLAWRELSIALGLLAECQNRLEAFDAATQTCHEAIAVADGMVQKFPQDPTRLVDLSTHLRDAAYMIWDRFRQADLPTAEAFARRALETHDRIPATVEAQRRQQRWEVLGVLAAILDARGTADPELWEQVAAALPDDARATVPLALAWHGVARSRLRAGQIEAARTALERTDRVVEALGAAGAKMAAEAGWLRAELAIARGDHAAAAAMADAILAVRTTWMGRSRAAASLHAAWSLARTGAADPEVVAGYGSRAAGLYRSVVDELRSEVEAQPQDPFFVLPFGFANVRLAQIEAATGEAAAARQRLAAALPQLEAVRAAAHVDLWDAAAFTEGATLLRELQQH